MEINETRKGKYSKIILREKKLQKRRNRIKSRKQEKIKLIIMKNNLT
jgi:urease accessory protein UreE